MARNLALIALSITLGLLFVTIGLIKLTPAVNADMHKEMVSLSSLSIFLSDLSLKEMSILSTRLTYFLVVFFIANT